MPSGYGQIASQLISGIGGAVAGGLQAGQSNSLRSQIIGAYSHLPQAPNLQSAYMHGWNQQMGQDWPAAAENFSLESKYLPYGAQLAANIYNKDLPQFAQTNLNTLNKIDPQFMANYNALGNTTLGNLAYGSSMTPDMINQDQSYIRGAQASRGNVLGNAPVAAEGLYLGNAGQALLNQREQAAQGFINGANPQSQFNSLAGTGGAALASAGVNATTPWQYQQQPTNFAPAYMQGAQTQWADQDTNALAQAAATASAPAQSNPWIASLIGAGNAIAGNKGGGGSTSGFGSMFGGGGASGSNPYGPMMSGGGGGGAPAGGFGGGGYF